MQYNTQGGAIPLFLALWFGVAAKPVQHINILQHKIPDDMSILHLEHLALSEWG